MVELGFKSASESFHLDRSITLHALSEDAKMRIICPSQVQRLRFTPKRPFVFSRNKALLRVEEVVVECGHELPQEACSDGLEGAEHRRLSGG